MFIDYLIFTYWTRKMHLVHRCATCPTIVPCTWQMTQDLYVDVASLTPSSEPLQIGYKHLRLTWRPMRSLACPHSDRENHKFIMWRTRGQPLDHYFWKSKSSFWNLWTSLGLLESPMTSIIDYSTSWKAHYSVHELVWWACHQKIVICTLF